jgi:shikimate dehydrogenase
MNKKFAVLGSPIAHSKSPNIHSAAYRVLGEDWMYERHEVAKGSLMKFIESSGAGYFGFSVTMPLKENAYSFAEEVDQISKLTKASNTLALIDGKWFGFNTDVFGIVQAIRTKTTAAIETSLIIGSGATAKSAMVAVAQISPGSRVYVFARNKKSAKLLVEFGRGLGLSVRRSFVVNGRLSSSDVVISTLPGGALDTLAQRLLVRSNFKPKGLLLDVAYDPWPSQIAELWTARGSNVTSGKEMLVWQALAQIRIFKHRSAAEPLLNEIAVLEAMRIAVDE